MGERFFITTAIDYTNGPPHIGHAYEKVLADVIARYHRLRGDEVFFLTGVDQHGQKVQQSAEKQGLAPQQFVDEVTAKFVALWEKLDVDYDTWAATTDERHKSCVRKILQRLWDDKDAEGESRWLYKAKQGGWYSIRQEQFLTDKERGEDGEFGPEWGQVEFREEENYYFRLSAHKQWLLDLIDDRSRGAERADRSRKRKPLVIPEFRAGELRNAVEKLSGDLCISRPKSRLSWGIEFPFDPEFVTYVWFDALVNYISFAPAYDPGPRRPSEPFLRWWRSTVHVIGKDILIPAHGIYWPVMLKALGFGDDEIPQLLVHGWWNSAGNKMSKSLGNVIDPDALADKYGAEALRYYLMSDIVTGKDADFSEERLSQRYNTDLANNLGNLLNRTLNMAQKYREGALSLAYKSDPMYQEPPSWSLSGADFERYGKDRTTLALTLFSLKESIKVQLVGSNEMMAEHRHVAGALEHIFSIVSLANGLVEIGAPWKLAKDPSRQADLDAVLYHLAEGLRIVAILISPVLPRAAEGIFEQLNWRGEMLLKAAIWGGLRDGHVVGKPVPLFPRIEVAPAEA